MNATLSPPLLQPKETPASLPRPLPAILRSKVVRGVATLTAGTALAHLMAIAAAPVLTRLYSPDDFGILAAFVALVGLLTTVGCLGYERSIPLPAEEKDALSLVGLCGLILTANVLFLFLVMGFWGDTLLSPFVGEGLARYAWLIAPGCFFISLYEALTYYATRRKAFSLLAWTKVYQGGGMIGCQLGWGFLRGTTLGLLVGDLVGRALGIGALGRLVGRSLRQDFRPFDPHALAWVAKRYWRFPVLSLPSTLLNRAAFYLPKLIMAAAFAPAMLGYLMLADSVLHAPTSFLGQNMARVYIGEFSERWRTRPESCGVFFRKFIGWLCLMALPSLVVIYFGGPTLFRVVFGREWEVAGQLARVLAPVLFLQFILSPVSPTFFLCERQGLQLAWDIFYSLMGCGSVVVATALRWDPAEVVGLYAAAQGLAYLVQGILLFTLMRSRNSFPSRGLNTEPRRESLEMAERINPWKA